MNDLTTTTDSAIRAKKLSVHTDFHVTNHVTIRYRADGPPPGDTVPPVEEWPPATDDTKIPAPGELPEPPAEGDEP